jgi:D-inositol-3-phosphate glycosyltransferase
MRILFILEHFTPSVGGVEKLFSSLAADLSENHEVTVLTLRLPGTQSEERMGNLTIKRVSALNRYIFSFLSIPKAIRLAKKADIIHTTTYNGALPAWIAARIARKKVAITVHEVLGHKWHLLPGMNILQSTLHRLAEKLILLLPFDIYACVSEATKKDLQYFAGVPESKISVVYNGIDYNKWRSHRNLDVQKSQSISTFLYYGRPGYTKGLDYLLHAWKGVIETGKKVTLKLILGEQPETLRKQMLRKIFTMGLSTTIEILDPMPEEILITMLASVDCVIVPSLTEGFGFNIVENAALQNRIIATSAGSIPEVISGEYILCEPMSAKSLQKAIIQATENRFQKTPLRRFELEKTVENYKKLYRDLTATKNIG